MISMWGLRCLASYRLTAFSSGTRKRSNQNSVEVSYFNEDQRPPFVFSDAQDAKGTNVTAQHAPNVAVFALKEFAAFSTHGCGDVPDMRLERVDQKKLSTKIVDTRGLSNAANETKGPLFSETAI